jgi:MFS family permease
MNPSIARYAVLATFILHGTLVGSWAAQIPLAKERLGVGPGWMGLALLSLPVGAIIAMPLIGSVINRYGSATVTKISAVVFCLSLFGPTHAPTLALFMLSGVVMGSAMGSMDVAMNTHGLAVERAMRKPIMSVLHGGFSLGSIVGSCSGALLMATAGPSWHILIIALASLFGVIAASRYFLSTDIDKGQSGSSLALPSSATIGIGALCFLALLIEGSVLDWGAIFLREKFQVQVAVAAMAFGTYQAGMAFSRFTGDMLRVKFGAVSLVFVSAVLTALGTAVALLVSSPIASMLAFVVAGIGIGNIAPVFFAGGGRLEPESPGHGIAAVTTMGYTGFLAGPPLIGIAAEFSSLPTALGLTVLAALIIAAFSKIVKVADTY